MFIYLISQLFNDIFPTYNQWVRILRNKFRDYFFLTWLHFFKNFHKSYFKVHPRRFGRPKRNDSAFDERLYTGTGPGPN